MWIVPRRFGIDPALQQRQYTEADRLNRLLRIAKPKHEPGEGLDLEQDASVYVSQLEDGRTLAHEVEAGHGAYIYLLQGRLDVNGQRLATGDAAYVWSGGRMELTALVTSELLLVDTAMPRQL
jgi:redox-sensitive bicupin YhaK (pirin superfamily)